MKKYCLLLCLYGLPFFEVAAHNYRIPFAPLGEGAYEIKGKVDMFNSSGSYDHSGLEQELNDGESFSIIDSKLTLTYGYGESLQFIGAIGFRSVSAEYTVNSDTVTTSNSGLESYTLGVRYSWQQSQKLYYSIELLASQTPYTNTDYANLNEVPEDEIILGDSGNSFEVGLGASYLLDKDWMLNLRGAYRMPGNNLSPELDFMAESAFTWTSMSAALAIDGVYAIGSDEYTDNTDSKPVQGRAPSFMYNSINRTIISPRVQVGWAIGSWRVDLYGSQVVAGKSTDKGTRLGIQLVKMSAPKKNPNSKTKESFKEYSIEATVLKVSPKGRFVQIDQGVSQDIEKGMRFDFYETDFFGGNELIATGIVYETSLNRSIVKIIKKYAKKTIHKGFTARAQHSQ
ncbi:MAG: hypothetical protein CME63_06835 [Halobacteriovoraceae bacterium]|nr:hypothetical protein [Halobacteriovoraceae bacterium]|tara:strand:- start:71252 stop:72448 length:1197 start_codon:yes stop_codon:yes gene_type:complete